MLPTTRLCADALLLWFWILNTAGATTPTSWNFTQGEGNSQDLVSVTKYHHNGPVKLHIFIYETESDKSSPATFLLEQANALTGVRAVVFGQGSRFEGYASKYDAVRSLLHEVYPDDLVVITDGRDVLINNPANGAVLTDGLVDHFIEAYDHITNAYPNAVVISAEAQCCVSALTHTTPGGYFYTDGSRKDWSCMSGQPDCMWAGDDMAIPWESFMKSLALDRVGSDVYDDVYLNAGLMAGSAENLAQLVDDLQMTKKEDDQAVLTDFMHLFPDRVVLDYEQRMFGNNRGGLGDMDEDSCMFYSDTSSKRLVHTKTSTLPLFIHSPGGFLQCHIDLASKLGLPTLPQSSRRQLTCKNYKHCDEKDKNDEKKDRDDKKDDDDDDDKKDEKGKKDKKRGGDKSYGIGGGGWRHGWTKAYGG